VSSSQHVLEALAANGLVELSDAKMTILGGGVSSDVWRVDSGGRSFVVKRCVPKLRVQAEWYSNPARLRYEFLCLQTVAGIVPDAVPALLGWNPDAPYIAMEFLGAGYENWKSRLLRGEVEEADARRAGHILARIHRATRGDVGIAARFETREYFTQLRIDAYLLASAARQDGPVAEVITNEAGRLSSHRECLVHGDYSPKNMLTSPKRFVVLDCETACFCDPAFDLAFVLNHLLLKALYHAPQDVGLHGLVDALRLAYRDTDPDDADAVEDRTARLLPMLTLARVDGKSPVEYLPTEKQEIVRSFARPWIASPPDESLSGLVNAWFETIGTRLR
jgi:aminoglycoside phosphotransferase (APT) family kinase protein